MHDRSLHLGARLAAMCLLIVGLALAACGTTQAHNLKDPFAGAPLSHLGDTVKLGTAWVVTVNKVTANAGQGVDKPTGDDTFLLVDLTFTNVSSQDLDLYTVTPLVLRDASGQRYTQITTTFTTLPDGTIAAGASAHGVIPFEVSAVQRQFLLAYYTGNPKDPHAIWSLNL